MVKSVIKEILIIILLIIAILLILGIMFYDYTPNAKKVPTAVAEYTLSAEIENELAETINASQTQNIVQTYRVDNEDLELDKKKKNYDEGKINPFSKVETEKSQSTNNNSNSNNNNNSNSYTNTQETQNESGKLLNTSK